MAYKMGHYATVKDNVQMTTHRGQKGLIVGLEGKRVQLQFGAIREWFHESELK